MDMAEWARHEVEIACKREAPDREDGAFDYGCLCYESALKAYLSLTEDNHSGMSFSFTKGILTRLMDGRPLTPIEDVPEVWNDVSYQESEKCYQCVRMTSLFKTVHADGTVTFSDVNRVRCHNMDEPHISYSSGHATRLINAMYPITMPYNPPNGRYELECEEYLTDRKNGDYDTRAYLSMKTPDGETVPIYKYFKDGKNGAVEITIEEFAERQKMHKERERREMENEAKRAQNDLRGEEGVPRRADGCARVPASDTCGVVLHEACEEVR